MALGSGAGTVMSFESQLQFQTPERPGDGRGSGTPGLLEVGQFKRWPLASVSPSLPAPSASAVLALTGVRVGKESRVRGEGGVMRGGGGWSAETLSWGEVDAGIWDGLSVAADPLLGAPSIHWDSLSGWGKGGGEQRCPSDGGRRGRQTDRHAANTAAPEFVPSLASSFGGDGGSAPRSPMWSGGSGKARGWEAAAGGRSSPSRLR